MKPEYIIIHHSLTKDSGTVSWAAIRRYHKDVLGWSNIGYHFGIEAVGSPADNIMSTEILIGRFPGDIGAHCVPRNGDSIGVCLVGNFDKHGVPIMQWSRAVDLCLWLKRVYPRLLVKNILGHREAQTNRTCPGKNFDMDKFRRDIESRLL